MPLEIILSKRSEVDSEAGIPRGDIDPSAWENLFFKELNIRTIFDYIAEGEDPKTYEDYYSDRVAELKSKYPLMSRLKDYYEDAFYGAHELQELADEMSALKKIAVDQKSLSLLDQLATVVSEAINTNSNIMIIAD